MTEPINFDYDSYLSQVPEALREQIEPAFKSYKDNLESGYKTFSESVQPYKEFEDQGWTPEHVGVGLDLLKQLNENPERVYNALLENYPQLAQQQQPQQPQQIPGQQQTPANPSWAQDLPPELVQRMDQQEQLIQLMFQGMQQQQGELTQRQQQEQEAQQLKEFEAELDKVAPQDKYPRHFILSYITQGQSPQEAIQSYTNWYTSEQSRWRNGNAPLVAPAGGGGLPSEPIDTSKLKDIDRRNLITQYLENANRQNG